ncbi:ferric-chelate reductase 1-like [Porites lutea]|uniref:ferric-chelate reductase 1-like n=1 Tax=Porites lutea TaxID=51062 RepID=UPI003CC5E17A
MQCTNSCVIAGISNTLPASIMRQGSFRFPDNCPDADCDFLVTYQASGDNSVVFELRGRGNWAGVGFSGDNQMPDTDILICASETSLSGHYYASGRTTPTRTDPTPLAVEIAEQSFNGGVVSCRITREVNPAGLENFRNLEEQQFLLGAIGGLSGATIGIHSERRAWASAIDVRSGGDAAGNSAIEAMVLAHGILMTLAWPLFAFVGLFTARYMRQVWEPRKLLGEKAWFTVHRTLMTITLLLTITATILIFVHVKGWSSVIRERDRHMYEQAPSTC